MLKAEKSSVSLHFTRTSRDRSSRKIPTKISAQRILPILYIPSLPTKVKRHFSERKLQRGFYNTTHPPFRERATHPQREIIIAYSPSLFHCHTLRGDLYPNISHTFSKCKECFGAWEALEICQKKSVRLDGCNWAYCGIQKTREDMTPRSPLVAGAWRAQVHWQTRLGGSFVIRVLQLIL